MDLNYLSSMIKTNDFLRLYVSTNGIVLAGFEFSDSLLKLRNPLMNLKYVLKKMYANYKLEKAVSAIFTKIKQSLRCHYFILL